jgi:hypothetical protein
MGPILGEIFAELFYADNSLFLKTTYFISNEILNEIPPSPAFLKVRQASRDDIKQRNE